MSSDKTNGKITNIEIQMMLDEAISRFPYQVKVFKHQAKELKARYDALKDEGFSEKEALEIIKARGTNL